MNAFVPTGASRAASPWDLPFRLALREMRGGLRGFAVFVACIALGVMAIAGIGSFAASLGDGLTREGRIILGGDVSFQLILREADTAEMQALASRGELSTIATLRAMARAADGHTALIEMKAVDAQYPLYGAVALAPDIPLAAALAQRDGVYGAVADTALMARLGLKPGDRVHIGNATFAIRAALDNEPDKLAGGIGFGPRLLTSIAALHATGLLQPGSLVRWHYRLRLDEGRANDAAVTAVVDSMHAHFPRAGWEIRTRRNASPSLARDIDRFTEFLTLVGLTALLIGGVGVANAVKSHLDRRRNVIATLKSLGATGGTVFAVYLAQVTLLALIGVGIGIALGAALPFLVTAAFGKLIPLPIAPALQPGELALAALYGLLTAVAFTLWPLGRTHDVPVSALFREQVAAEPRWPRKRYMLVSALVVALLAGLAVALAYDRHIAAIFVAAAAAVFVALRGVAALMMLAARKAPRTGSALIRFAVANVHRPGALTPTVVLSLGLGLALLVVVTQIDGNLRRQFTAALPEKAPSFFFIDIPAAKAEAFDAFIKQHAPQATLERVPMLRGRIVAANGIPVDKLKPSADAAWVLRSDRGITYATAVPRGSRLVVGKWWPADVSGPPLVSFERKIADGLGLKVGDTVTVNVLGREITGRIANLRSVDWESLGINFVMVFSPNTFRGAPHTHIATLTYPNGGSPEQEAALLKAVADAFPMVTSIRVKEALDAIGGLVSNLVLGIRGASLLTLIAAVLVLGGALAAGHRHRVYDAVILKTLGATRKKLLAAYAFEYLLLGLATALFGVAAGSIAAYFIVRDVMTLSFVWLPGPAAAAAIGALVVTVLLGLIGTFIALGHKPAPVLRNL